MIFYNIVKGFEIYRSGLALNKIRNRFGTRSKNESRYVKLTAATNGYFFIIGILAVVVIAVPFEKKKRSFE